MGGFLRLIVSGKEVGEAEVLRTAERMLKSRRRHAAAALLGLSTMLAGILLLTLGRARLLEAIAQVSEDLTPGIFDTGLAVGFLAGGLLIVGVGGVFEFFQGLTTKHVAGLLLDYRERLACSGPPDQARKGAEKHI